MRLLAMPQATDRYAASKQATANRKSIVTEQQACDKQAITGKSLRNPKAQSTAELARA
jgi:hypothetical protein